MKKLVLTIIFMATLKTFAQSDGDVIIPELVVIDSSGIDTVVSVTEAIAPVFRTFNLVDTLVSDTNIYRILKGYSLYHFDFDSMHKFVQEQVHAARFHITFANDSFPDHTITLQRNDLRRPDFKTYYTDSSGQYLYYDREADTLDSLDYISSYEINTFKGLLEDDPRNYIRANIDAREFYGYLFDSSINRYIYFSSLERFLTGNGIDVSSYNYSITNKVIFYYGDNYQPDLEIDAGACIGTGDTTGMGEAVYGKWSDMCTPRYLQIAVDIEYAYYVASDLGNNDIQKTLREVFYTLNQAEGVFSRHFNINFGLTFMNVFTDNSEPFIASEVHNYNDNIESYWTNNTIRQQVERDLILVYSARSIVQQIGSEIRITGANNGINICQNNFSICWISRGERVINYVTTTAHEIGHAFNCRGPNCFGHYICDGDPPYSLMVGGFVGNRGLFLNYEVEYMPMYNHIVGWGSCLSDQASLADQDWTKSWANIGNEKYIGPWHMNMNDYRVSGDFDGDGDDELLFMNPNGYAMMLNYYCPEMGNSIAPGWYYQWGNNGNSMIGSWKMQTGDKYYIGDFNTDGRSELLTISPKGKYISLYSFNPLSKSWDFEAGNLGNYNLFGHWRYGSTDQFYIADFDGDNKAELLTIGINRAILFDYSSGNFTVKWQSGPATYNRIGGVEIKPYYNYLAANYTLTSINDELLTFAGNWVTLLRYNNTLSNWDWVWSQYGANSIADMYILPLNISQHIFAADLDPDSRCELLVLNESWVATADFDNGSFVQNYNNTGSGTLIDWRLNRKCQYMVIKPINIYGDIWQVLGIASDKTNRKYFNTSSEMFRPSEVRNKRARAKTNVDLALLSEEKYVLFPNPGPGFNGKFTLITHEIPRHEMYKIFDLQGREVKRGEIISESTEVDMENHIPGLYFLYITDISGISYTYRLIKK